MKKLLLTAIFCSFLFGNDLKINYDLDIASSKARAEGKNIVFYVYSSNCPWCKRMEKNTYSNTNVKNELNKNYIFVKMNKDIDDIPQDLIPRFVPTTYILDANQDEIFAMYGYKDSSEFLRVLEDLKSDF